MKAVAVFRHSPGEGPGYFATFLERRDLPWTLFKVDAGEALPATIERFSGLVFMGGPMSVNDPLPWIDAACALIRSAVAQGVPVLGHCLGAQLMAKALGAAVTRNPVKEIGWGEVRVGQDALARDWFGETREFMAFHWHGETFALPPGAACILASPYCPQQAFALGPHLALQCHVEMTAAMIEQWCVSGAAEISAHPGPAVQQPAAMRQQIAQHLPALNAVADQLYSHWIGALRR